MISSFFVTTLLRQNNPIKLNLSPDVKAKQNSVSDFAKGNIYKMSYFLLVFVASTSKASKYEKLLDLAERI